MRPLSVADAAACDALAHANEWATDEQSWRSLLCVGDGFAFVDDDGAILGTVVLNRYEPGLAVIAMMLVHPTRHRQGLGRTLLEHALAAAGDAAVSLYATKLGEPLYAKLGFVVAARSVRVQREALPAHPPGDVRPMSSADLVSVRALDARSQGASRSALVEALVQDADRAVVVERAGALVGFGLARVLGGTRIVGPVVASDDEDAVALVTALGTSSAEPLRLDLAPPERALHDWLTKDGRATTRACPLMVRGGVSLPGERGLVRVMASLAYG